MFKGNEEPDAHVIRIEFGPSFKTVYMLWGVTGMIQLVGVKKEKHVD